MLYGRQNLLEPHLASRTKRQVSQLVRLAVPIIVARSGIVLMMAVDIIMVGHFSTHELAYQAIGLALIMPMVVIGMGLLMGTLVICANCYGAGQYQECGKAWRQSIPYALALGIVAFLISLCGGQALLFLGQSPELAKNGGEIMRINGYGLPAFLMFLTTAFFLEGIKRPKPWMVTILVANILNLVLNWILIFGNLGAPEMGAEGAAWATTAARWFVAVALFAYIWNMKDGAQFAFRRRPDAGWKSWQSQRSIGYASSISIGAESCAFATLSLFAGWLGALPLAAYSVCYTLISMVFMVSLGLGSATAITVGNAYGRKDHRNLILAGWSGLGTNTFVMAFIGVHFAFAAELLARMFTADPKLILLAAPMIGFLAYLLVIDGGQAVIVSALRGRRDVWIPCGIQVFSYFWVMLPMAFVLTFPMQQGPIGLLQGILVASSISILLQGWRFQWLARRDRLKKAALS